MTLFMVIFKNYEFLFQRQGEQELHNNITISAENLSSQQQS